MNGQGISKVSWVRPARRGQDARLVPALPRECRHVPCVQLLVRRQAGEAVLFFRCRFQGPGAGVQASECSNLPSHLTSLWSGFLRQATASCRVPCQSLKAPVCRCAGIALNRDIVSQLSRLPPVA